MESGIPGLVIREEKNNDYRETEALVREAFWNRYAPGCSEHYVLKLLREDPGFLPWHSLVACFEGRVIGQVLLSPATIKSPEGQSHRVLILGPVCCMNAVSGRGVGSALMRAAIKTAKKHGERAILLMGNPGYYHRFNFVSASQFGIRLPGLSKGEEADYFMALPLFDAALDGLEGTFHESPCFHQTQGLAAYDSSFPQREKLKLPGQLQG